MKRTARPGNNHRLKLFVRGLLATGIAGAAGFGALSAYNALAHHAVNSGFLIVCGSFTIFTLGAARSWDDLTDTDVLALLRTAPLPHSAESAARHLGRRPGPVRLSLARLEREGRVVAVDAASATVHYRAR
ncbi:hypothetical protein ACIRRH_33375 [Kitasatospora sp. NPDC101235]|uniref:hypothetical protein n=1 Tax=Kitasatospora sp. NPDC101235 TaxID=3364101 RepID=UPI003828DAEB